MLLSHQRHPHLCQGRAPENKPLVRTCQPALLAHSPGPHNRVLARLVANHRRRRGYTVNADATTGTKTAADLSAKVGSLHPFGITGIMSRSTAVRVGLPLANVCLSPFGHLPCLGPHTSALTWRVDRALVLQEQLLLKQIMNYQHQVF